MSPVLASTITALLPPTSSEASLAESDPRPASINSLKTIFQASGSTLIFFLSYLGTLFFVATAAVVSFPSESLEKTTPRLARL